MDKLAVQALSQIPTCTETLALVSASATTALQAAESSRVLLSHGHVKLAAARLSRCEKLLRVFREYHAQLSKQINQLHTTFTQAADLPQARQGSWNRLPDTWWHEHASQCVKLLDAVLNCLKGVDESLCLENAEQAVSMTYKNLVENICDAVKAVAVSWEVVKKDVAEWEELAITVVDGIGETGSLI